MAVIWHLLVNANSNWFRNMHNAHLRLVVSDCSQTSNCLFKWETLFHFFLIGQYLLSFSATLNYITNRFSFVTAGRHFKTSSMLNSHLVQCDSLNFDMFLIYHCDTKRCSNQYIFVQDCQKVYQCYITLTDDFVLISASRRWRDSDRTCRRWRNGGFWGCRPFKWRKRNDERLSHWRTCRGEWRHVYFTLKSVLILNYMQSL